MMEKNKKSAKILTDDYKAILIKVVDHIALHRLVPEAIKLLNSLEQAMEEQNPSLRARPELLRFYKNKITELKFIALPTLDEKEVISLLQHHFTTQFKLEDYDIVSVIKEKMLGVILISDRNKLKENLIKALLENQEKITANHEQKTVQDWVKNYISRISLDEDNNLAKAQYLTNLRNDKNINPKELGMLRALFELYDQLSVPSDEPNGLEEEMPIAMNNKLYVFRGGVLEEIPTLHKEYERLKSLLEEDDNASDKQAGHKTSNNNNDNNDKLTELKKALDKYSENSLEHRVISQEIKRLEKKN